MTDPRPDTQRSDGSYNALHLDALSWAETAPSFSVALNGTAPFSIDAWIRFHGIPAASAILAQPGTFAFGSMGSALFVEVAGMPIVLSDPDQSWLTDESWHYVCATFDGGMVRLYIDGKFNSGQSLFGSRPGPVTQPFTLGEGMHGLMRRVRIYDNALTASQVLNNMFGPPAAANLVADFDFTQVPARDTGPNAYPITLRSNARLVTEHPALSLGTTGFARPFFDWAINPGGQQVDPYTVQAWIYVAPPKSPPQGGAQQAIFVNSDLESDTGIALFLRYDPSASGYTLVSQRGSNGNTGQQLVSTGTVAADIWTNVATSFDGFTLRLYISGRPAGSIAAPPIPLLRAQSDLLIGSTLQHGAPTGAATFQGFIQEVDVWSTALTDAQISEYTANRPAVTAAGLAAVYDFSHSPARNLVTGHSVGLAEGAAVEGQLSPATRSDPTDHAPAPEPGLDAETLRRIRESLTSDTIAIEYKAAFAAAIARDPGKAAHLRDLEQRFAGNPTSLPFLSTEHRIGEERLVVFHTPERSYVGLRMPADAISECDWWKIRLILELVSGILAVVVGVSVAAGSTQKAAGFVQKMLENPTITSKLAVGAEMTASDVLSLLVSFQKFGFLRPLLLILLEELGFWTMLRVFARMLSIAAGIGIANAILMFGFAVINFIRLYGKRPRDCDPPPVVTLRSISYNHDPMANAHEALSIRQNLLTSITIPEWVPGRPLARAAYAIAGLAAAVRIRASFQVDNPAGHAFRIRAAGGGMLGGIDATLVDFAEGNIRTVTLDLNHQTIVAAGIRFEDSVWTWEYQVDEGAWEPMAVSNHRIYVLLDRPTGPWVQAPDSINLNLPWTDILDRVCHADWAGGAITADDAAARITTKVNDNANLVYDGGSHYIFTNPLFFQYFQCSQFLTFLATGVGGGNRVNCTDCASIVTTFANAIGCSLYTWRMSDRSGQPQPFKCNPIIAIGANAWAPPFGGDGYAYHEVAFKSDWGLIAFVNDACLKVNTGTTPWQAPAEGTPGGLPTGPPHYPFTSLPVMPAIPIPPLAEGENTYRERLAANVLEGLPRCQLEPGTWMNFWGRRPPI
jgi:hypothetical protein